MPTSRSLAVQSRTLFSAIFPREVKIAYAYVSFFAVLGIVVFHGSSAIAHPHDTTDLGIINVKNLAAIDSTQSVSAIGDGKADDTSALQAAADIAIRRTRVVRPQEGSYMGSSPAIYFPAGHYKISDEIRLGAYANIVSDSRAIIEQSSKGKSSFVFKDAYTVSISGIRFLRGANQIAFSNRNINSTTLDISNCEFQLSEEYAIMTEGTTSPADLHMSASLTIDKCKFIKSRKVLRNVCDYSVLRDSWVQIHLDNFDSDTAAFMNTSGVLMLDNMIGVPVFGTIDQQGRQTLENNGIDRVRWIDNYGTVLVQKSRFGGEFGGIPIIHHFGVPDTKHPKMGQTICIENSWICAGPQSRADSAVITLRGGIPQLLRIVGNSHLINGTMLLSDQFDVKRFLQAIPDARDRIRFEIRSNMASPSTLGTIPQELRQFIVDK